MLPFLRNYSAQIPSCTKPQVVGKRSIEKNLIYCPYESSDEAVVRKGSAKSNNWLVLWIGALPFQGATSSGRGVPTEPYANSSTCPSLLAHGPNEKSISQTQQLILFFSFGTDARSYYFLKCTFFRSSRWAQWLYNYVYNKAKKLNRLTEKAFIQFSQLKSIPGRQVPNRYCQ